MYEKRSQKSEDLKKYDSMSSEELEQILRLDVDTPDSAQSDTELTLYIMDLLADRRRTSNHNESPAQRAYQSFMLNYLPDEDDTLPKPKNEKKPAAHSGHWLRNVFAAAAVLAVVFFGTINAGAFRSDFWDTIIRWTEDTFILTKNGQNAYNEPSSTICLPFSSLQEALATNDQDSYMVPTWIPSGYSLNEIKVDNTPLQNIFIAYYEKGDKTFIISVRSYLKSYPSLIEKSDDYFEVYESNGIAFYIFSNDTQYHAAWITDAYECVISGDLELDEIKKMIDSINWE